MKKGVIVLTKKSKVILFSFIIMFFALAIALACVFIEPKENKIKQSEAAYEYWFDANETISYSDYLSTDRFIIKNEAGYKSFCRSTQPEFYKDGDGNIIIISKIYGGKQVFLDADITLNSQDSTLISGFYGEFNGWGHTITYNFIKEVEVHLDPTRTSLFCTANYGTIKNLKLKNPEIHCLKNGYALYNIGISYAAIFADWNEGTIESCILENPAFKSERDNEHCFVAPFVLRNSEKGSVKECFVIGTMSLSTFKSGNGMRASYFVDSINEARNCVFAASIDKRGKGSDNIVGPSEHDTNAGESWSGNYLSADSAYSGSLSSGWFKYKSGYSHSSGFKFYLRAFIGVSTYRFYVSPTGSGTVSKSSVEVPAAYNNLAVSGSTITISNYGETITATPNTGYRFVKWSNSYGTYTAEFEKITVSLSFTSTGNDQITETGVQNYNVTPGTSITCTKQAFANGTLYKVKFEFEDESGAQTVEYEVQSDGIYCIKDENLSVSSINSNTTITLTVILKFYNTQFG